MCFIADDPYATNIDDNTIWPNSQVKFSQFFLAKLQNFAVRFCAIWRNAPQKKKLRQKAYLYENAVAFAL